MNLSSKTKKIAIIGGPASGKTSIINQFMNKGHVCMEEISRKITLKAQNEGVDQLFLKDPIWFSEQLLEARKKQFIDADTANSPFVFFDRGLPDVIAYLNYIDSNYSEEFINSCIKHKYDKVFILMPWKDIYIQDNERYETFEQATEIHEYLIKWYTSFNYELVEVPQSTLENRVDFILNNI
jgi:predicted ATPase